MTNLDSIFKSRDITLPTKVHLVKAMVFPVVMYGCESWTVKKAESRRIDAFELWCWRRLLRVPWTAAAAKSLQSCPTLCNPIEGSPRGSPIPGILQARTLEWVAISFSKLWPPHSKSWLIGKDSDAGRNWEQEENGMTEAEMAGWNHQLDGREVEWTPGVVDGQGGLVYCNSWGCKESDTTERLNWTELNWKLDYWKLSLHCKTVKNLRGTEYYDPSGNEMTIFESHLFSSFLPCFIFRK